MPERAPHRPQRAAVQPDRVRRIEGGFAFLPNRFLHDGFFASLTHTERSLYFFLVLAGDRNGISYYSYDRICSILEMTLEQYIEARNALIAKDLLAFDGTSFQILSLPPQPVVLSRPPLTTDDDLESHDPATISQLIRSSLDKR
jgi:hypothetical protein